jgi:hypothetical protein
MLLLRLALPTSADPENVTNVPLIFSEGEMQTQTPTAHVTLGKGKDTVEKTIPSGSTAIPTLKNELGVAATDVLYLRHGNDKRVLGDGESLDVENGMHFEAVEGGGVS